MSSINTSILIHLYIFLQCFLYLDNFWIEFSQIPYKFSMQHFKLCYAFKYEVSNPSTEDTSCFSTCTILQARSFKF